MAKLLSKSLVIPMPDFDAPDWQEKEAAALKKLQDEARAKAPKDELAGEILRFGVADGYAQYLVKRSKPLTLAHIHMGDGYQVHPAMIRGLRLRDVKHQVEADRRIRELFPGSTY